MGTWWGSAAVRITHLPTGLVVRVVDWSPSLHKMRAAALRMLKGKIWTMTNLPDIPPIVRTYTIPDGERTIPDLETGQCIDDLRRSLLKC